MTAVAVIQHNNTLRKILVDLVNSQAQFRCVCACSSSTEAVTELPKHRPHIALMDIHLPDQSGIVCTARLTEDLPHLQVIMLAPDKDAGLVFQSFKAGACGFILKNSPPDEIIRAIAEARDGGAPMTAGIARIVVRSFRAPSAAPGPNGLTPRESEILMHLAEGLSNKEIAQRANIAAGTVRIHLGNIFKKIHVRSRTEAALKYTRKN